MTHAKVKHPGPVVPRWDVDEHKAKVEVVRQDGADHRAAPKDYAAVWRWAADDGQCSRGRR